MEASLDEFLKEVGNWGLFQKLCYVGLCFSVAFSVFPMCYIFSARDIKYRCLIPECEVNSARPEFNPEWLRNHVPYKGKIPERCWRYETNNTCNPETPGETIIKCDKFVYERPETTIVHDFKITCDENLWKLTIVGTVNVIGELVCLSYSGFISDKFGRRNLLICNLLLTAVIGIIQSFSINYAMYLSIEFMNSFLGSAIYSTAFILAMELVSQDQRNKGNTILSCMFSTGQILLGLIAWMSPSWRIMLRVAYSSVFLSISFFWLIPESIRWLLSVGKSHEASLILLKMSKMNKKNISNETIQKVMDTCSKKPITTETKNNVLDVLKNKTLLFRTITCSYCWLSCNFVYYGLTIQSVTITDHVYLSFIFTAASEIPAYLIYYLVNEKVGRRKMMFLNLIGGGLACLASSFFEEENFWPKIATFLLGKCCLTIAYTVLYVYTTEMFPTSSRHSVFSICSMIGRFGSMAAPQIPLLARIAQSLPLVMFSFFAITSGALSLIFPETINKKLPDTINEAVHIDKS